MNNITCIFAFVGVVCAAHNVRASDSIPGQTQEIKNRASNSTNTVLPNVSGPFRTQRLSKSITYREACPAEEPVLNEKEDRVGQQLERPKVELSKHMPGIEVRP